MLARDGGIEAVVVQLQALRGVESDASGTIRAEAGASHASVGRFAAQQGLSGLEFAAGIPGTVGGWVAMNAGIGPVEMKDVIERVDWIERENGEVRSLARAELDFHYRALEMPHGATVVRAHFRGIPAEPETIHARVRELLAKRRETQPVDQRSCGSVFKNPPGDWAGRLIEAAGLKGSNRGGAVISEKHANFIENRGGATASDVLELIDLARAQVLDRFGIELETEVRIVGENSGGKA